MDNTGQVTTDRVQFDRVLQPGRERGHRLVVVVAARLNRRSTIRCTRRRSGLDSAAVVSVEPATATGDDTGSAGVASSTRLAYTPTSSPVTIA